MWAMTIRGLAAATVLVLCLWGGVNAAPLPLFTDDFDDGNDNGWTQINRSWHVIDGRYHLDGCYGCNGVPLTGNRDGFSYTHVDDPTWTDYTFEFTFDTANAPSADNPDWAGTAFAHHAMVFFRAQGPLPGPFGAPTQYRADFGAEESFGRAIDLLKYVNGDPTPRFLVIKPISDFPLLGTLIGTYTGKITVSGGHIQIFVNNQLVVDFTDPDPIPFGGIGLGATWEVNAWFDNIRVTPLGEVLVNDRVTFEPIESTFRTTADTTGCPSGFSGTFSFEARLTNISTSSLSNLVVEVTELTGGNLLQNADGGPEGVGARVTAPRQDGLTDGVLSSEESVDVPFMICLQERQPFSLFVDVLGVSAPTCVPPPEGLVSWWPGDGNADDIQSANDGTLQHGATFAQGLVGQAFSLDGIDDFVNVGNAPTLHVSAGNFTVEAWVKFDDVEGEFPDIDDMSIADKMRSGSGESANQNGWRLMRQRDHGHFWFCLGGGTRNGCDFNDDRTGTNATTVRSTTVALENVWYHVVGVLSSDQIAIYVNGIREGEKARPLFTDTHATDLLIGANITQGAYVDGLVDEVEIYNRGLSAAEIQAIFNAGSAGKCKDEELQRGLDQGLSHRPHTLFTKPSPQ